MKTSLYTKLNNSVCSVEIITPWEKSYPCSEQVKYETYHRVRSRVSLWNGYTYLCERHLSYYENVLLKQWPDTTIKTY